jgi:hypothetical protein
MTVGDLKTFVATAPQVQSNWTASTGTMAGILNKPGLALASPPTDGFLLGADKVWIDAQRAAGSFVRLGGDTMTGALSLAVAPASNDDSAKVPTTNWVRAVVGGFGGPYVPVSGGSMTGALMISPPPADADNSSRVPTTSWVRTFFAGLGGPFVSKTGDTMTGNLRIASAGAEFQARPTALTSGGFNVTTGDANGGLQLQSGKYLLMYSSHGAEIGSGHATAPITISPGWTGAYTFRSTEATFTRPLNVSTQETGNAPAMAIKANPSGVSSLQLQSSSGQWYGQMWSNGANDMQLTGSGGVWVKAGEVNMWEELRVQGGSTSGNPVIFHRGASRIASVNAAGDFVKGSDVRAKRDILAVPYGLATLLSLRPVTFRYLHLGADAPPSIGFIAQEVQEIVPEAVAAISEDKLGLIDSALTPVLVKAIQELTAMVEQLTARVATLEGAP